MEYDTGMQTVTDVITVTALAGLAAGQFGELVKAVVDVAQGIMVVSGEMHADEEALLLVNGAKQRDLWGINLYPDRYGSAGFIEFDSVINIRASQDNRSRAVESAETRMAVARVVNRLVKV